MMMETWRRRTSMSMATWRLPLERRTHQTSALTNSQPRTRLVIQWEATTLKLMQHRWMLLGPRPFLKTILSIQRMSHLLTISSKKTMAHYRAKVLSGKRHIGEDDGDMEEENQYEYGDMEAASGEADTSDFSTHQFTAKDEARDPMGSDDSEADAAQMDAARSKALSEDSTFDSEDEPSPDN